MSEEMQSANLDAELKGKRICRFCLEQAEPLSNIYSKENRMKSAAPLPLQVMACASIEIFSNDGMPSFICEHCRLTFDHCYRFKNMCKKADNALRQFPLTGTWPKKLEQPKIPEELVPHKPAGPKILLNRGSQELPQDDIILSMPNEEKKVVIVQANTPKSKPRLLNKNSMKILNKEASMDLEPVISQPVIKRDNEGNVAIVTEILNTGESEQFLEPDPVKTATPVETNVFPCQHCDRSFPLRQLLDIHMVNHNRERSFECSECQKAFFSKYDLSKHFLIHTGEKPYKCVVCSKEFTRSTLLHRHQKTHIDIPKFICVFCEKPFLSKEEMEAHAERHKKKRPFACKICDKSFAFKQGLERHEVVHSKNQPFPCQYCDQSFSTPSKLSRHLTAHAGKRPYPCKLCPKSYLLSHHLSRHLRSHKEGTGSYKCSDCDQVFSSRDNLIYHSALHATQSLTCPLCKDSFTDVDTVTEHVRQHAEGEQFACEFCDLIFMTADKLQEHADVEHSNDLQLYQDHDANMAAAEGNDTTMEGEIIEEFVIEEYTQDDDEGSAKDEGDRIKEEMTFEAEDSVVAASDTTVNFEYEELVDLESEYEAEPPAKVPKVDNTKKQPLAAVNTRRRAAPGKQMIQPTLKKVFQSIPKSVTVVKKSPQVEKPRSSRSLASIEREVVESLEGSPKKVKATPSPKIQRGTASTSKPQSAEKTPEGQKKLVEMMIGDKKVKVQKITVTKAEAAAMAKEGRIEMKNGTMILKQQGGKRKLAKN